MFKRVLKTLSALVAGHGIQTLTQLLLPPAFIAAYGVQGYGEWLVLSAAVGYLGTLDFGLQTYVLNELTALYHQRKIEQFHRLQSVGLRLMLGFVAAGTLLSAGVFLIPIEKLLKIPSAQPAVSFAMFLLALQILVGIPFGLVIGIYRTFGYTHRGVMWSNLYRSASLILTLCLAFMKAPFWLIALSQCSVAAFGLVASVLWLKRFSPDVSPRLSYWDRQLAIQTLKPSGLFGLFILNNFLVYQFPVLVLQRLAGSQSVVVFSVGRTLFSFVRQGVALFQQALAPELTRLHGLGDRDKLVRLYRLSEALLFSTLLIANVGLLLAAHAVLSLWLKRPRLYQFEVFVLLMTVSVVASVKEYKLYFQYATNNHGRAGVTTFFCYLAMAALSVPAIQWFGLLGFLLLWTVVECVQVGFVHACNTELFRFACEISLQPALRLAASLTIAIACAFAMNQCLPSPSLVFQGLAAVSAMLVLAGTCYFLFDVRGLLRESRNQLVRLWAQ